MKEHDNPPHSPLTQIRPGTADDLPEALKLVRELAVFEKAGHKVTATIEDYHKGFADGLFEFLLAEVDGKTAGTMIYYYTWSTWKGKMMHLEDFVVAAPYRRQGLGELLMTELLEVAQREACVLVKWQVLEWNDVGIKFYEKMGNAIFDKEWWDVKVYFTA